MRTRADMEASAVPQKHSLKHAHRERERTCGHDDIFNGVSQVHKHACIRGNITHIYMCPGCKRDRGTHHRKGRTRSKKGKKTSQTHTYTHKMLAVMDANTHGACTWRRNQHAHTHSQAYTDTSADTHAQGAPRTTERKTHKHERTAAAST